jgi:DNA repair and recombination protein RAD54 and RAD54-like protein
VPVYLIHNNQIWRGSTAPKLKVLRRVPRPTGDVKHVLDCLGKKSGIHTPGVLFMGYNSFLALKGSQETKFAHRSYMAKTLRESPGILILDEAYNPRSTKSRLKNA